MFKNFNKGYITSAIGLIVMVADSLYFFGIIHPPKPDFVPDSAALFIAFILAYILFRMPAGWIEEKINKWTDKKLKD
jgi:hypothetical protein